MICKYFQKKKKKERKTVSTREEKSCPETYSEWESWELDSGRFHGLFSLLRYLKVQVKGKKFCHHTILTP